ncbi:MAG TPA: Uma2 family endonuclease [Aggregatilineales bacterium]|nr:Uma2 family endonuclease [Anaerolineae bacterium]HUN07723.1 Uma2 family endonuclease [Aggregatilineales bacterium]
MNLHIPMQEAEYTVEDFERMLALPENQDRLLELIDGEIVEKMPTRQHGVYAGLFVTFINIYLFENPIGRVAVEARHRPVGDSRNDRLPDVSFVSDVNRPLEERGAAEYMPDLCVEIQSPDDSLKLMREKADFYLANGSRLVWLVYPSKQLIEVWTATEQAILKLEDTLTGGDVLPGFAVPVKRFFV